MAGVMAHEQPGRCYPKVAQKRSRLHTLQVRHGLRRGDSERGGSDSSGVSKTRINTQKHDLAFSFLLATAHKLVTNKEFRFG